MDASGRGDDWTRVADVGTDLIDGHPVKSNAPLGTVTVADVGTDLIDGHTASSPAMTSRQRVADVGTDLIDGHFCQFVVGVWPCGLLMSAPI